MSDSFSIGLTAVSLVLELKGGAGCELRNYFVATKSTFLTPR